MSIATDDLLTAGREALGRHDWQEAYDLFTRADIEGTLSAEDLEALGEAAWWSSRIEACIAARERAYAAHLEEGDPRRAARIALQLVRDYTGKLAGPIASAWFRRAERLLEGHEDSVEYGYLEMMRSRAAHMAGDFAGTVELGARAVEIGERHGDPNLLALSLMYQGMGLVSRGDVDEGLALLDEATVAAVGGELIPAVTGIVYCNTILTCAELADYQRAGEWTEAAKRWCERQSISGFPGLCRVRRAEIMRLRGAWAEAEAEARRACSELQDHGLPALAGDGFYEIAEIRRRMGDLEGAEAAYQQAHGLGRDPQPGLALLRLAQGRGDAAALQIRRALTDTSGPLHRARKLPARVMIALAEGDVDGADEAARELEEIAGTFGSSAIEAAGAAARATVQLDRGDMAGAVEAARRARDLWQEVDAPYEMAEARMLLGRALRAEGAEDEAVLELQAARAGFEKLGAIPAARQIDELLGVVAAAPATRVSKAFMFTDIVKSTNLVEAIGDEAWEDLIRWHDRALRTCFANNAGDEVAHAGDGFFVAFPDPRSALDCAVEIQRKLADHRRDAGFAPQVRIGVHVAEATERAGDFGGKGVHEAARIAALAGGEEIVASEATVLEAGDDYTASDPREVELKGISEPVRIVVVAWR